MTLNGKYYNFDEIFITGCTGSCLLDNFQCNQWSKFRQNDNFHFSVSEWVIKFNSLFRTVDSEIYVIHISHVIVTYTSELLSSLP